jgi:hypothetical protein
LGVDADAGGKLAIVPGIRAIVLFERWADRFHDQTGSWRAVEVLGPLKRGLPAAVNWPGGRRGVDALLYFHKPRFGLLLGPQQRHGRPDGE